MLQKTLQERVQQRKEKTNPPQTTKKVPFQKHKNKNNKTCENCDPMKLELSYIQNAQQRKAWPQRGRESTLTAIHSCHRPRIPFGHVLIERRCAIKHCKRGCNKEKKDQTHHTNNNNKVPFQKHKTKITKRVRIGRGHREGEREYTYCFP